MKRTLFSVLALIALVFSLTGCAKDVETFEKYVKEGNYAAAITLYQEKLMENSQDYMECRSMLETYLNDSLKQYSRGELSGEDFDAILYTMEKLDENLYLVRTLSDVRTEYGDIRNSKADFRTAEEYRDNGRLEDAWDAFSAVLPEDEEHFSEARRNMEALQQQITENCRNAIVQAYAAKDYPAVFLSYRAAEQNRYVTVTEDLTEIYEASAMEYLHATAEQAEQAFAGAAKDYNAALELLRCAKAAVSGEAALLTELEALSKTYQEYIPVSLTELDRLQKATYVEVGTSDSDVYTDINSNTHDKNSVISATGAWHNDRAESDDEASVSYNLNYQYSTLTGTIYRPYSFLTYTSEIPAGRCKVKLYGDGALLYEFSDPGDSGAPWDVIPVEVDVSGVRKLTVVIYGCWNSAGSYGNFPEWNPGLCLADCILQK